MLRDTQKAYLVTPQTTSE